MGSQAEPLEAVGQARPQPEREIGGNSTQLNFQLGGAVARNLILFGEVSATSAFGPMVRTGDLALRTDSETVEYGRTGMGIGLSYYLPGNLYLGGGLRNIGLLLHTNADREKPDFDAADQGTSFYGQGGYEWWVSPAWALGIAAELEAGKFENQKGQEGSYGAFALFFSATYN